MTEKNHSISCYAVQDLLPLYAEDLVQPETRSLLKEHLESCGACSEKLNALKTPLPKPDQEEKQAVDCMKKIRSKDKRKSRTLWILAILGFICGIFLHGLTWQMIKLPVGSMHFEVVKNQNEVLFTAVCENPETAVYSMRLGHTDPEKQKIIITATGGNLFSGKPGATVRLPDWFSLKSTEVIFNGTPVIADGMILSSEALALYDVKNGPADEPFRAEQILSLLDLNGKIRINAADEAHIQWIADLRTPSISKDIESGQIMEDALNQKLEQDVLKGIRQVEKESSSFYAMLMLYLTPNLETVMVVPSSTNAGTIEVTRSMLGDFLQIYDLPVVPESASDLQQFLNNMPDIHTAYFR